MKKVILSAALALIISFGMLATEYHVAKTGSDQNDGSAASPFLTINKAAMILKPGDVVTVHEGVYREWVQPRNSGADTYSRITYQAAEGEEVWIKGSEVVTGWKKDGKGELVFDDKKKPVMIDQKVALDRTGVVRVSLPAWGRLVYRWE